MRNFFSQRYCITISKYVLTKYIKQSNRLFFNTTTTTKTQWITSTKRTLNSSINVKKRKNINYNFTSEDIAIQIVCSLPNFILVTDSFYLKAHIYCLLNKKVKVTYFNLIFLFIIQKNCMFYKKKLLNNSFIIIRQSITKFLNRSIMK